MPELTKFLLVSQNGTLIVARGDNKMIIGVIRDQVNVTFGEGVNPVIRCFLDPPAAQAWLKEQCRAYAGRDDVDFEKIPTIVEPAGRLVS